MTNQTTIIGTPTESSLDVRMIESLQTIVNYFNEKGEFSAKLFNMAEHADRVAFSRFAMWAINRNIELRVNRVK